MKTFFNLVLVNIMLLIIFILVTIKDLGIELLIFGGFIGIYLMIHSASETHNK